LFSKLRVYQISCDDNECSVLAPQVWSQTPLVGAVGGSGACTLTSFEFWNAMKELTEGRFTNK